MNSNISFIISGTVSGFSQLFCFDVDNKYQSTQVDFDFRSRLSGLGRGQVAYAVCFTQGYIAYSRICPILDAYRRDGILVVSVLLGHGTGLSSPTASSSGMAIEEFLRSIQDRFLQLHFRQSALDTNYAALMQNDYMDILSRYQAIAVEHRPIQPNISADSVAYVITDEFTVSRYFDTVTRRSFLSFSTIFFVESNLAPQSARIISEAPEEKKVYAVRLKSRELQLDQLLGTVSSLDEKVFVYNSEPGFEIIREQLSYNDITSNVDSRLRARIQGEEFDIEYTPRVKRTEFNLVFADRENRPFDPSGLSFQLMADGATCPSGTWSFENNAICVSGLLANRKLTLSTLNPEYHLVSPQLSSFMPNKIVVLKCFSGMLLFPQAGMLKTVALRNIRFSDDTIVQSDVKEQMPYRIYGELDDWEFSVSSEHYEPFPTTPLSFIDKGVVYLKPKAAEETMFILKGLRDSDRATLTINGQKFFVHAPEFSHKEVLSKPKNSIVVSCPGYKMKSGICDSSKRKVEIKMEPAFMTVLLRYAKIVVPILLLAALIVFGIIKIPKMIERMKHKAPSEFLYEFDFSPSLDDSKLYDLIMGHIDSLSLSAKLSDKDTILIDKKGFNGFISGSFNVSTKVEIQSFMLEYHNSVMLLEKKSWPLTVEVKQQEDESVRSLEPSEKEIDEIMRSISEVILKENEFYKYSKTIDDYYNKYCTKNEEKTVQSDTLKNIQKKINDNKYDKKDEKPYSEELIRKINALRTLKKEQPLNSENLIILLNPATPFSTISGLSNLTSGERRIKNELLQLQRLIQGAKNLEIADSYLEKQYPNSEVVKTLKKARELIKKSPGTATARIVKQSNSIQAYYVNIQKEINEKTKHR